MCGFTGFLSNKTTTEPEALLRKMARRIFHRGPDDDGVWFDTNVGIGLAHRRLAIVDLSPAGHQPMRSPSGRYVLVFNGEIYNHLEIRDALDMETWRGHSDTETLVHAIERWGLDDALKRAIGMFALAVWDREEQELHLARDRAGEKPLYFGWQGNDFLFGSELKSLRAHPAFCAEIDRDALALYMRHNCVPSPHSIYQGIKKVGPGTIVSVSRQSPTPISRTYWSALQIERAGFNGSADEAVDELETLLQDAVNKQMMADVPLGAFLSGGIDSSAIVALMQRVSAKPVQTFSIGFEETLYNEAEHAKAVAKHIGSEHRELYVSPKQCRDVIPKLPSIYDEPFADSSQIPTYLVSELAQKHVTVSLSGDAGDELFCGYNRYAMSARLWGSLERIPAPLRRLAAKGITTLSPNQWNEIAERLGQLHPAFNRWANVGEKAHKGAGVLASKNIDEVYRGFVSHWDPSKVVIGGHEPESILTHPHPTLDKLSSTERMMLLDFLTYLPDDILTKVDRAAMAVSLETRVPFLDHRIIEFAWSLPLEYKLRDGQTKWALRQLLYRHVPKSLIERPKMGFGVPIDSWLRGPLRQWAEALLSQERLKRDGYFSPTPIRQMWNEHLSGQANRQHQLWDVLMFNAWLDEMQKEEPWPTSF